MGVNFSRGLLFVATMAMLPAVASAGDKKADAKDPNRIVCEKQEELGSRLGSKRVCMTAAEWQQKRLNERQMIDRSQTLQKGPNGG